MSLENYGGPLTTDDIMGDPHKYGWVTFDEYKLNREKFVGRDDDILASADKGSILLKNIKKQVYEIEGYRCESLEEVQRHADNMGISLKELETCPELNQAGAGKFDLIVRFVTKQTKEKRASWR